MELIDSHRSFGGTQQRYKHESDALCSNSTFSIYVPEGDGPFPVVFWLSGLTCTDENFVIKAGAQQHAAEHRLVLVASDTSPRGEDVPDDPQGEFDLGHGAGFYLNASEQPWSQHYRMYDYVVSELPALVAEHFPVDMQRQSIAGHSMGGHGALTIAFKNPGRFRAVSAFAPICKPTDSALGRKAFRAYLGADEDAWQAHDASALIKSAGERLPLLIDQGSEDEFLDELKPQALASAAAGVDYPITLRMQQGYDHSYFFVASFIGEHLAFHARHLSR